MGHNTLSSDTPAGLRLPRSLRIPRAVAWVVGTAALLVAIVVIALATWVSAAVYNGLFEVDRSPDSFEIEVVDVGEGAITLRGDDADLRRPGTFGLEWAGGYAQVGALLSSDDSTVTRVLSTSPGPPVGEHVGLDTPAYIGDPLTALGLPFEDVLVPTPFGGAPAWLVGEPGETWVIVIHGRGEDREETLRALPLLAEMGLVALSISYRNDAGFPAAESERYGLGTTEWVDLEAAVRFARERGAQEVVLYGYSTGGAIVLHFLRNSELATSIDGIVLDAPLLDLARVADRGMADGGVPGLLQGPIRRVVTLRFGVDWADFDLVADAEELRVPLLLFHGDADDVVPVEASRSFAALRPELVRYVEVAGAGHVQAWNADRDAYERELRAFLTAPLGLR